MALTSGSDRAGTHFDRAKHGPDEHGGWGVSSADMNHWARMAGRIGFGGTGALIQRARKSAVFVGMFATAIRVGANLLLVPLLLTRLSTPEMAVWSVFLALGGFANLTDFGFGPAISRVYTYLWAGAEDFDTEGLRPPPECREPNLARIRQLNETVRFLYRRLSGVAVLLSGIGGTLILMKSMDAVAQPKWAWMAWGGYLLTIGYNLETSRWMLACQGIARVRELQTAYTWAGLGYVLCAGVLLWAGWGLMALVAANFVKGLIARAYCRHTYYVVVPGKGLAGVKPDTGLLKKLWPNAFKFGLISIGAFCLTNGSVLMSGYFLGNQITASFGLSAQIGSFLTGFAALWLVVKWPQMTILRTQGRLEEMSVLFARRLGYTMVTFVVLAIAVLLIGNKLLEIKGAHTRLISTPMLIFYFIYLAHQLFYVQFGSLAYTENVVPFFKVAIFTGVGMLVLSFVMTWAFGFWGLLAAPLI